MNDPFWTGARRGFIIGNAIGWPILLIMFGVIGVPWYLMLIAVVGMLIMVTNMRQVVEAFERWNKHEND